MKPKQTKICKICKAEFKPFNTTQKVCGWVCASEIGKHAQRKNQEKRARKEKLNFRKSDKSFRLAQAQIWFNKYIRLRDEKDPCISCQRHHKGQYHAGHYRSVGAARQLRFNEDNCHKQCSACNNYKSGNIAEYRINLIKKIGLNRVEELENSNKVKKYELEEIRLIEALYKQKCKDILNASIK